MRQALHIFRKDTRLYWPYLAGVLAMTVALVWLPLMLEPSDLEDWSALYWAAQLVPFVLPMMWWLAITRAVHADSLVGPQQFWVTRPYSWKSLLAAKALFCTVWIALPYVASEWIVLGLAGFSPWPMAGDLLRREAAFAGWLILPPLLLAAVTRNTRGFPGGIVAVLAMTAGVGFAFWVFRPAGIVVLGSWFHPPLWPLAVSGAALLGWQFAARHTGVVRSMLLVLVACSLAALPGQAPGAPSPRTDVRLGADLTGLNQLDIAQPAGQIRFAIPLDFSLVSRDGLRWKGSVTLTGEGSVRQLLTSQVSDRYGDWLVLDVEEEEAKRWVDEPVTVEAMLYVQTVRPPVRLRLPEKAGQWAFAPGIGAVSLSGSVEPKLLWRSPVFDASDTFDYSVKLGSPGGVVSDWDAVTAPDPQPFLLTPLRVWCRTLTMPAGPGWLNRPGWEGALLTLQRRKTQPNQMLRATGIDLRKYKVTRK